MRIKFGDNATKIATAGVNMVVSINLPNVTDVSLELNHE